MAVRSDSDRLWNRIIAVFAGLVVLTLVATGVIVLGGVGAARYSQATPDDVIQSAVKMVKNGDARRLPDLIHADSEEMRGSLKRLGVLLAHMQTLAASIKNRFPDDIARYRKDADEAIAKGKPPAMLTSLISQMSGNGPPSVDQEAALRDLAARLFADPYGWIEQNEGRLTTVSVTDDLASIMVDGKPAAGVGLTLKLEGDKWYLALPTNIPPLSNVMPKAPEQWRMINSLIKILDNTVVELTADIDGGSLGTLQAIGDRAREKVIFPGALWAGAYAADMDARGRIDRNLRQYRERQKAWAKARAEKPVDGIAGVSEKLLSAMTRIASSEIPTVVRARKATRWGDLSDKEFEYAVAAWLIKQGLNVRLEGPLADDTVGALVASWESGRGQEVASKKPK